MIISKTPFCKILTQNVLNTIFKYFFQTSAGHKSFQPSPFHGTDVFYYERCFISMVFGLSSKSRTMVPPAREPTVLFQIERSVVGACGSVGAGAMLNPHRQPGNDSSRGTVRIQYR